MYQQVDSSLLGHVDLSKPTPVWNTLNICPTTLTNSDTTGEKLLLVMGNNGLSFTVQIAQGASSIVLDEPHTFNVHGDEVNVFQFTPPPGISDRQLDITATSQSNVAAYLKVSQNCKEVDLQEGLENINYKKESLRLSFSTKGRITLSRVSTPPLTDSTSRWFIGIGLKNVSGDVKLSESKNVTLKLTRSFDYNYLTPICILFFVSLVIGILVSIVAYFLFKETLTQVGPGEGNQVNNSATSKISLYITFAVGVGLMEGASLFVFLFWYLMMIQKGDRDNCYYNDFCYRVGYHDIPFNLMISNLTYIVLGLILVVWLLITKTMVNHHRSFSTAYALALALVFQGFFSALYHLCPGVFTFQFDTAFMYIIVGLIVMMLCNGTEQNRSQNEQYSVGAFKFFLFFITSAIVVNFLAPLIYSDSWGNKIMQTFFPIIVVIWCCAILYMAIRTANIHQNVFSGKKFNTFLFILGGLVILVAIFVSYLFRDPAQTFLFACIICCVIAIVAKAWLSRGKFGNHPGKGTLQFIFIIFALIILFAAYGVFLLQPTTNKTSSPENSRDQNKECVILEFFDWHDLWHFLSSFGLFMGMFFVMFISSEAEQSPQAETRGNNEPEAQGRNRAETST